MAEDRNLEVIYTPIKEKMRENIGSVNFRTYIESLKPVDHDGDTISSCSRLRRYRRVT